MPNSAQHYPKPTFAPNTSEWNPVSETDQRQPKPALQLQVYTRNCINLGVASNNNWPRLFRRDVLDSLDYVSNDNKTVDLS